MVFPFVRLLTPDHVSPLTCRAKSLAEGGFGGSVGAGSGAPHPLKMLANASVAIIHFI
jgi:hypothetical protein